MLESFVTAFIIYFVVIDPVGNAPIFVAVTQHQDRARKLRTALEGTVVATMIMLFFALCGRWVLAYLNISEAAFRIAGVMTGYAALLAVMALTGVILTVTVVADRWLDERVTMVFSRITAIILAGLSVQYVIDGLTTIGIVAP